MPKAKKKSTKAKAIKAAKMFDKHVLHEDGQIQTLLRRTFDPFRRWHAEQQDRVDFDTYYEMQSQGPMVAIEKIEKLLRTIKRDLNGSAEEWCNNNNYK